MDIRSEKRFGCIKIDWLVENICFQTSEKDWCIQSPEFIVDGPEETKWCMILRPASKFFKSKVSFILKRSALDSVSGTVWVNLRLCLLISVNQTETEEREDDCKFPLSNGEEYKKLLKRLSKMDFLYSDLLTITCKMIVYNKITHRRFAECGDVGIKLLSEDLLNLYKHGNYHDVLLRVGKKDILAHEAILCARNEVFCDLIENDMDEFIDEYSILRFPCSLNHKELKKVLAFLYSGNLKHVLKEPSHGISDWASYLDVKCISDYYIPDELTIRSGVDVKLFTLDLSDANCSYEACFCEIKCSKRISDITYELLFRNKININIAYFCQESLEATHFKCACLEIFVYHLGRLKPMGKLLYPVKNFMSMNKYKRFLEHVINTLEPIYNRVIIKFRSSCLIQNSCIENQCSIFRNCFDVDMCYLDLSLDLENFFLLNDGEHGNLQLRTTDGGLFRVHHCIVASRSDFLKKAFQEAEHEDNVTLNMDSAVLCMVLVYIYSGFLTKLIVNRSDKLPRVYKAAAAMNLPILKTMCSEELLICFKTNPNIRCRAMKIAEECQDVALKNHFLNHLFTTETPVPAFSISRAYRDIQACMHCA